jgi:hypothetical protein
VSNNQRKMMRSMRAASGGMHDAPLARGLRNSAQMRATKRAAKKQIKTREERAWREDSSPDPKEAQS